MPSVGFKLFADSSAFERGLANAETSTKSFRGVVGNLGGFLKGTFAATIVAGMIAGFRDAISAAMTLRDETLKTGGSVDLNTAAVARFGDALLGVKNGSKGLVREVFTNVIGFLNQVGESAGGLWNKILGGGREERAKANEEAEAHVAVLEAGMDASRKLGDFRKQAAYDAASEEEKINLLLKDNVRLMNEQAQFGRETAAWKERELTIEQNNRKMHEVDLSIQKHAADEAKKRNDEAVKQFEKQNELLAKRRELEGTVSKRREELGNAEGDRGKMTLQELANVPRFGAGVGADIEDQASTAREVLDLQAKADEARRGGRADEASGYLSRADEMKGGLGALKSSEREDPARAYKEALKESETQLAAINAKLAGTEP